MRRWLAGALVWLVPALASAQMTPDPPGPYVVDVRGTTLALPTDGSFFTGLATSAGVPSRGFGLDAGAHLYPWRTRWGVVGVGANLLLARGKVGPPDVATRAVALNPQVSLNFGTAEGWSYVSAGYGAGSLATTVTADTDQASGGSGAVPVVNVGGGARWFTGRRMAVGFDIRMLRFGSSGAGTPATTLLAASVGVSLR